MPEPNKGQRVAQKILAIMKDVTRVEKDGYNIIQKYQYVSEGGMLEAIRGKIIEHGLVVIPTQLSCLSQHYTFTGKEGNPRDVIMTETCTEYTIIDTDSGDSLTVKFFGQGMDSGDKGVYKATTGANKYFLMKTFMIPTGDDPEVSHGNPTEETASGKQIGYIKKLLGENVFEGERALKIYERATELIAIHDDGKPITKDTASKIIDQLTKLADTKKA
jgi:hypothetical protein